jgi:IclR family acetate operon transcriptional repressor
MKSKRSRTRIQSVARASQLLLWIANQPHGATAREAADAHGLALPTTYHLLNTLADQSLLTKNVHRRYVLGRGVAVIAQACLRGMAVPEGLLAALRQLARATGETAYLAAWGEEEISVLASVEGSRIVRVAEVASGPYEHGHARANGKVLLAFADPEVREGYLRAHPLEQLTDQTICDRDELDEELARIRARGYAYDAEEFAPGVSCVAAPLRRDGHIVAALGLSVPSDRFAAQRPALTEALLAVASAFPRDLDTRDFVGYKTVE